LRRRPVDRSARLSAAGSSSCCWHSQLTRRREALFTCRAFNGLQPLRPSNPLHGVLPPPRSPGTTVLWRHNAPGCLVASAAGGLPDPRRLRRLRHLGRVSEWLLLGRQSAVPLLFAGDLGRFSACDPRPQAGMVAGAASLLARAADPALSRPVPLHLLLLPRRLLQGLLGRHDQLRGG